MYSKITGRYSYIVAEKERLSPIQQIVSIDDIPLFIYVL